MAALHDCHVPHASLAQRVCSVTLALDEVNHLLRRDSAPSADGPAVVPPGDFAAADHGGVTVPALLQRECVVVVHACSHYTWRSASAGPRAPPACSTASTPPATGRVAPPLPPRRLRC